MEAVCMRCGYEWKTRSSEPARCPQCKSMRWNKDLKTNECQRCGLSWVQRGTSNPRFCPGCHSPRWNSKKETFKCPKCGKVVVLKTNSRIGLCPECDLYEDKVERMHNKSVSSEDNNIGMVNLWSNGKGLGIYVFGSSENLYLYHYGVPVCIIDNKWWMRTYGVSISKNTDFRNEKTKRMVEEGVERIFAEENADSRPKDCTSMIKELYSAGMSQVMISLKLHIPFDYVMKITSEKTSD